MRPVGERASQPQDEKRPRAIAPVIDILPLQDILESADIAIVCVDALGRVQYFTAATERLFSGLEAEAGLLLADLGRRFDDTDFLNDALAVRNGGVSARQEVHAEDGRWLMREIRPMHGDKAGASGLVISFADISDLKEAEQGIEVARAYLDSIIATIRQPLVVLDEDWLVISASSSFHQLFRITPDALIGKSLPAAVPRLSVPAFRSFLQSIEVRGSTAEDCEMNLDMGDLDRRTFSLSARVLRDQPSAKRKILVAIVDITQARREGHAMQSAMQEAERANLGKSRFLAAASHDLRQPLQTIGLIQGLLEKRAADVETRTLVRRLDETVATMSSLLDKLLDINELEAGTVRPEISDFQINAVLGELRSEFLFHTATNQLDWRVVPSSLTVHSDPRLLEQIVRNLLSNAVKYTEHGKLLLGCRRQGDKVRIEVWDTGAGIPEAELEAIFKEFHQLNNPARERSKGLGLGLAIVHRLAHLLGHSISVRSKPGAGSVFSVEVPRGKGEVSPPPARIDKRPKDGVPSRTVLIVEDDPDIREMLQLLFESEGYRTAAVSDAVKALDLVASHARFPDLVVADYNLPKNINGLELVARLQATMGPKLRAIVLTGDISTARLLEIARYDCLHVNKPIAAQELLRLSRNLLAQAPDRQAPAAQATRTPIYVIDDDQHLRETLRDVLQAEGYSVTMFASGDAFFQAHLPGDCGCVLVDARMPGMSGLDVVAKLKSLDSKISAIVITGDGAVPLAVEAMKMGAVDFIEKPVRSKDLLASVARALALAAGPIATAVLHDAAAARVSSLTGRQKQILDLVLAGHPSKNIAADLGISQRTVENHRAAIMRKTGSNSLPDLVRTALAAT